MYTLCLCNTMKLILSVALLQNRPVISVNFRKLFGGHGYELRLVSPEEGDLYFYPKSVTALNKKCSERLPAMSWTRIKTSWNPI